MSKIMKNVLSPKSDGQYHFTQSNYEDVTSEQIALLLARVGRSNVDYDDIGIYRKLVDDLIKYYNEHNYIRYGCKDIVFPPVMLSDDCEIYWNEKQSFTIFVHNKDPVYYPDSVKKLIRKLKGSVGADGLIWLNSFVKDVTSEREKAKLLKDLESENFSSLQGYVVDGCVFFRDGCCSKYGLKSRNLNPCCCEKYQVIKPSLDTLWMVKRSVKYIGFRPSAGVDRVDVVIGDTLKCRSFKLFLRYINPTDFDDIAFYRDIDVRMYLELFEHILHCRMVRYRFDHNYCDKSIDYTGLFLQPYRDVQDYVIYKSYSGYKIFLKTLDCDFSEIHRWVSCHPTINGESVDLPVKECNLVTGILDQISADPVLLSMESTYSALLAELSNCVVGSKEYYRCLGYLKMSAFKCYGIRETCRGYILAGEPGLGKTYDILQSTSDSYWLPYDYKTKQFYDGYGGQTTMVIDDVGHYTSDEWKLVIRLVNDAPWSMPMAQAKNKDFFENVSRNLLLTTNNLDNLLSMNSNSRDAICRRMEAYVYLVNGMVEHRIYNKHLGTYELVSTITREELRGRLSVMTLPTQVVIPPVRTDLVLPIVMGVNVLTSYFKMPDVSRLLIKGLSYVKLPCSVKTLARVELAILVAKSCLEFFDWSLCVGKHGDRRRRYLKAVTGLGDVVDRVDYTKVKTYDDFVAESGNMLSYLYGGDNEPVTICGHECPVYDLTPYMHPVKKVEVYDVAPIVEHYSPEMLEMYPEIDWCDQNGDYERPGYTYEIVKEGYVLKDMPESLRDIYAENVFSEKFAPLNPNLISVRDESEYRPTRPITVSLKMKAVNELVQRICVKRTSKTVKRREQRKRRAAALKAF